MKAIGLQDGAYLQSIIDRIDGDLGYPDANKDTYCRVFFRAEWDAYYILIEDADVATLLTPEEQALCEDYPDIEGDFSLPTENYEAKIGYIVGLTDGTNMIGSSTTAALYSRKSLRGVAIWSRYAAIGFGNYVFGNRDYFPVPPQAESIIADDSIEVQAFVVEEDADGIPSYYLGF